MAYAKGTTLVASSPVLTNAAPNLPGGVKVVPEQDPSQMSVQWQTKNAAQPRVLYGTSPSALNTVAAATTSTYTKADIVSACTQGLLTSPTSQMTSVLKGWMDPGSIHKAMLTGLQPDTTYYYQARRTPAAAGFPALSCCNATPCHAMPRHATPCHARCGAVAPHHLVAMVSATAPLHWAWPEPVLSTACLLPAAAGGGWCIQPVRCHLFRGPLLHNPARPWR